MNIFLTPLFNHKIPFSLGKRLIFSLSAAQRWRRVLNPSVKKGPLMFAEEKIVLECMKEGLGWAAIGLKTQVRGILL